MTKPTLQLAGTVRVVSEADHLYDTLALALWRTASDAVDDRGSFHLALSGGSTPEPFYMRLVTDPRYRRIPWENTHIWVVDERRVPDDDDRSNFRMIRQRLADHVPTPKRFLHPIDALDENAADVYEREIRRVFQATASGGEPVCLDFVLLGMGDDAHTASLFSGSPAQGETKRWISFNDGPAVRPPPRITMTYPLLNAAREVAILVTGARKRAAIRRVEKQLNEVGPDPLKFPITAINPRRGHLTWYLDGAAAGQ